MTKNFYLKRVSKDLHHRTYLNFQDLSEEDDSGIPSTATFTITPPPLHFKICSYRPESLRRFCYRGIVTFATWEFSLNEPRSLFAIPANHIYPLSSPFPFDSFFPIPKFLFCGFLHFRDSFFTEARNLVSFTSFFFLGPFRLPQVLPRLFVIWWIWRNRKKKRFLYCYLRYPLKKSCFLNGSTILDIKFIVCTLRLRSTS